MRAVVVAHGDPDPRDREHLAAADLVVAADGGALVLERWGIRPRALVGDLDTVGDARADALAALGVTVLRAPVAKDESDTELALRHVFERGASSVVLLAAFGGPRLDHALANVMLLADPVLRGRDVRAVRGGTTVRAAFGGDRTVLDGRPGDVVSLVPAAGDAHGVTTEGLRYPLRDGTLRSGAARGVSNVIDRAPAAVSVGRGAVLVFEIRDGGTA